MELYLTDEAERQYVVSVESEEESVESTTFASPTIEVDYYLAHTIKITARVGEYRLRTDKNDDPAVVLEQIFKKAREEIDAWNALSQTGQPRHP